MCTRSTIGYLMSPVQPVDSERRRLELTLEHEILTVKNISSVVPGIVPQPSWLENTAVYTYSIDRYRAAGCVPAGIACIRGVFD